MASISVPDENREITDPDEIREFLAPHGLWYEKWDVEGRIDRDASNEEILEAYSPEIDALKSKGGFVTADVINVSSETPGLDDMLNKFNKEHTHDEDEVRFTVRGSGVFHVNPENGPVFAITVESGDLVNVPRGTLHWFNLCSDRTIRCIRLFEDPSGWAPHYTDNPVHENYAPICLGPSYLSSGAADGKGAGSVVDLS
ncbi:MAG: cupin domain-containing protein [Pirellulaceae bacterium]|nr:cupin domain-containing protein [Pirellulaceae bacterium]